MQRVWLRWPLGCIGLFIALLCATPVDAGTFPAHSTAEASTIENRVRAAQFLSRATFGPTPAEIEQLARRMGRIGQRPAMSEWIDHQFTRTPTRHEPLALQMIQDDGFDPLERGIRHTRYRDHAWWHTAVASPDQLRQRMAWALSQIFVVNRSPAQFNSRRNDLSGRPQYLGLSDYYDIFVRHAFENYRDVLGAVTYHPIMGVFLSHRGNKAPAVDSGLFPDENYAREVMQLLSIGLYRMRNSGELMRDDNGELIPTYDNEDIKTFARVFTGLNYDDPRRRYDRKRVNFHAPMVMHDEFHDRDEKRLLRGQVLPANQPGEHDVAMALDNLFFHPNCPPFIARLLIQRFVKSNPSKGYIRRVASQFIDNGHGVRGDLKAVIKAILLDREALQSQRYVHLQGESAAAPISGVLVKPRGTESSRLREPVLRYTAFIRAFNGTSDYPTGRFMIPSQHNDMNQGPYLAPSVFNFYLPDHQPQGFDAHVASSRIPNGKIFGPEFQIFTAVVSNRSPNQFRADVRDQKLDFTLVNNTTIGRIDVDIALDFKAVEALAKDPMALLTHLDLLLCHGSMSDRSKHIIADAVSGETDNATLRAKGAILAVLTFAECAVSE